MTQNVTQKLMARVAGLTVFFWVIKILSTTVGETAADFINADLGLGLLKTTLLMGMVTICSVAWQFRMKKYYAPAYWLLVIMMSIEGTLITDLMVDNFGVSLVPLDVIFTIMMLGVFYLWYKKEGTLSIHSITTEKREIFYWNIVLISFALGTGLGDTVSEYLNVGYFNSLIIFSFIFLLSGWLYSAKALNGVAAFWIAFIVTRPIGASLGDLMIQLPQDGGIGLGLSLVNVIFFMVITGLIAYLTMTRLDVQTVTVEAVSQKITGERG